MQSEQQKRMYATEAEDNFRWLFRIAASLSTYKLSSRDFVSPELAHLISDIGQFAEIAHGSLAPRDILASFDTLSQTGFPLENYQFIRGAKLVQTFKGSVAGLQGYVAEKDKSLVVAFSGTSSLAQAIQDLKVWFKKYSYNNQTLAGAGVHAGFWALFEGIRLPTLDAIRRGVDGMEVEEVIVTAHSMGGVMAYFLLLELMQKKDEGLLKDKKVKLVVFGCPRAGNNALVAFWRMIVERWKADGTFEEFSIRAYNDGVPSVPPIYLGYEHFASSPLYLYHEKLYHIPPSESEYTNFAVLPLSDSNPPDYPLGGHMYYNSRDMEKLQRSMKVAKESGFGVDSNWQRTFQQKTQTIQ